MSQFTRIVRPNQSVNINPPKRPDASAVEARPNIVAVFGANGQGKVMPGSLDFRQTKYQDKKPYEKFGGGKVIDLGDPFPNVGVENAL